MRQYTEEEVRHTRYLESMLDYYGKNGLRELSEKQIQDYEKMKRREKDLGN